MATVAAKSKEAAAAVAKTEGAHPLFRPGDEEAPRAVDAGGVISLVRTMQGKQISLARVLEDAARLEAEIKKLREDLIPSAMDELGATEWRFEDGTALKVKANVHVSITVADRPAAYAWFRANGQGAIIKTEVAFDFDGAADADKIAKLSEFAKKYDMPGTVSEAVHASTLKATVGALLKKAVALPECIKTFEVREAVLVAPKKKIEG